MFFDIRITMFIFVFFIKKHRVFFKLQNGKLVSFFGDFLTDSFFKNDLRLAVVLKHGALFSYQNGCFFGIFGVIYNDAFNQSVGQTFLDINRQTVFKRIKLTLL